MKKKLLVLMMAFAMILAFAACGGGGGSEAEPEAAAEPNAGVGGIVFSLPDGWTVSGSSLQGYMEVTIPDSDYILYANIFGEDDLENVNRWNPEHGADSLEAYYEKSYKSEEALAKEGLESTTVKVCDTDALYNKFKTKSGGYIEAATAWMYDGEIYNIGLVNYDSYDENGKVNEDVTKLTDEEILTYEGIVASVQPGDGTAIQKAALSADSVGSIAFEVPEGYTLTAVYEEQVTFTKDGSDVTLQFNVTDEDDLENMTNSDGKHPESLQEWYDQFLYEGIEETEIAGYKGHIDKWPAEDENYYNCSAEFLADDGIYNAYMGTDAWDENGNIREDAVPLTEDDMAAFDAFVASLKKK